MTRGTRGRPPRARAYALGLAAASLFALACGPSRAPHDPEVLAEARQIWQDRCTNCHGPTGNADGPQARHLPRRAASPIPPGRRR
jgi:mono/diheme cytochrome c family protein